MPAGPKLKRSVRLRRLAEAAERATLGRLRRQRKRDLKNEGKSFIDRRSLRAVRRTVMTLHRKTVVAEKRLANYRRRLKALRNPGEKAVNYLLKFEGRSESPPGSNNAPFLQDWENRLPHNRLDWMIPGQPWCGFAVLAAWYYGAGKLLPDGVVYTPNIVYWANQGQSFTRVDPYKAKKGDLVVFDFDGGGADHVGLALGPASGGSIRTVDGNSSVAGSQSNGGAVVVRTRPLSQVEGVARPK